MKSALITGVTGQDGSYLAEFLLNRGYKVVGLVRRSSSFNTSRIDNVIRKFGPQFEWVRGDLTDQASLASALRAAEPDEIYNLAAQSHVKVSFEIPVYTYDVCSTGVLRLLEAVRASTLTPKIYQASSSEMFGMTPPPQSENSGFKPESPYAAAKLAAHNLCAIYRDAYHMWIANGILFNHESPRRGETFLTRKVTRAVARILLGIQEELVVGNLESKRDWGFAPEYVEMMWKMLQRDDPSDYVISTGESHSVKEFIELAFAEVGVELSWAGKGNQMKGRVTAIRQSPYGRPKLQRGFAVVRSSKDYYRPIDPAALLGDSSKARRELGWRPRTKIEQLARIMVRSDMKIARMLLEGTRKHNEEWREYVV